MSLVPKIGEIRAFVSLHHFDFLFITETWLREDIGDNQIALENHNLIRRDRSPGSHGGVALYTKAKVKCSHLAELKAASTINRTVFDYRRADMDGLRTALDGANLSNCIESDDINDCWMKWKANFLSVVKTYTPTKRIKGRNFPPWMNGNIMYEIRKKEAVRKKLKSSPSDSLNNRFKQLRANVKKLIRESRSKFFSSLNTTFQANPKRFRSIFKLKTNNPVSQMSCP